MILCAVAFDPEHKSAKLLRIGDTKVDSETRSTDLGLNVVTKRSQALTNLGFKLTIVFIGQAAIWPKLPGFRECQKQLQSGDAARSRPLEIDIGSSEIAKDLTPDLGARY